MEDSSMKKGIAVKETIEAVTGLVTAVPVYQDAVQPAAKEIGKSLETVAKAINLALAPIGALVWGYDKICEFVTIRVSEKLKNVPEENIISPPIEVAGPTLEALRYTGHNQNLRELYANLLATSMDKATIHLAHPGYVEVLRNLTSDEAILLRLFEEEQGFPLIDIHAISKDGDDSYTVVTTNYSHLHKGVTLQRPDLVPTYLDNLCRLGILEIPVGITLTSTGLYEPLENDSELDVFKSIVDGLGKTLDFNRKYVECTMYGKYFIENVVIEKH